MIFFFHSQSAVVVVPKPESPPSMNDLMTVHGRTRLAAITGLSAFTNPVLNNKIVALSPFHTFRNDKLLKLAIAGHLKGNSSAFMSSFASQSQFNTWVTRFLGALFDFSQRADSIDSDLKSTDGLDPSHVAQTVRGKVASRIY